MDKKILKIIGTVDIEELSSLASGDWKEIVHEDIPFSVLGTPNGYMFTHGSASASNPTINCDGWRYNADFYLYRQDGSMVKRYRYLGSVTPDNQLAILLVPKEKTPNHHIDSFNPILNALPSVYQTKVLNVLSGTA